MAANAESSTHSTPTNQPRSTLFENPADPDARPTAPLSPYATRSERWTAILTRYGAVVVMVLTAGMFGWLVGFAVFMRKGDSPTVRPHAAESTNFHLTWGVATAANLTFAMCSFWSCFSTIFWFFAACCIVFQAIFGVIGGRKAQQGVVYQYPLSFRLLR